MLHERPEVGLGRRRQVVLGAARRVRQAREVDPRVGVAAPRRAEQDGVDRAQRDVGVGGNRGVGGNGFWVGRVEQRRTAVDRDRAPGPARRRRQVETVRRTVAVEMPARAQQQRLVEPAHRRAGCDDEAAVRGVERRRRRLGRTRNEADPEIAATRRVPRRRARAGPGRRAMQQRLPVRVELAPQPVEQGAGVRRVGVDQHAEQGQARRPCGDRVPPREGRHERVGAGRDRAARRQRLGRHVAVELARLETGPHPGADRHRRERVRQTGAAARGAAGARLRRLVGGAPELAHEVVRIRLGPGGVGEVGAGALADRREPAADRKPVRRVEHVARSRVIGADHGEPVGERLGEVEPEPLRAVRRQQRVARRPQRRHVAPVEAGADQANVARIARRARERPVQRGRRRKVFHQQHPARVGPEGAPERRDRAGRVLARRRAAGIERAEHREGVVGDIEQAPPARPPAGAVVAMLRHGYRQRQQRDRDAERGAEQRVVLEARVGPDLVDECGTRVPVGAEGGDLPGPDGDRPGIVEHFGRVQAGDVPDLVGVGQHEVDPIGGRPRGVAGIGQPRLAAVVEIEAAELVRQAARAHRVGEVAGRGAEAARRAERAPHRDPERPRGEAGGVEPARPRPREPRGRAILRMAGEPPVTVGAVRVMAEFGAHILVLVEVAQTVEPTARPIELAEPHVVHGGARWTGHRPGARERPALPAPAARPAARPEGADRPAASSPASKRARSSRASGRARSCRASGRDGSCRASGRDGSHRAGTPHVGPRRLTPRGRAARRDATGNDAGGRSRAPRRSGPASPPQPGRRHP